MKTPYFKTAAPAYGALSEWILSSPLERPHATLQSKELLQQFLQHALDDQIDELYFHVQRNRALLTLSAQRTHLASHYLVPQDAVALCVLLYHAVSLEKSFNPKTYQAASATLCWTSTLVRYQCTPSEDGFSVLVRLSTA
jgi:hypothetical protein